MLREQCLAYRRVFLQDSTDVFEERRRRRQTEAERGRVKTGPPPFSAAMGQATTALAAFSTGGMEGRRERVWVLEVWREGERECVYWRYGRKERERVLIVICRSCWGSGRRGTRWRVEWRTRWRARWRARWMARWRARWRGIGCIGRNWRSWRTGRGRNAGSAEQRPHSGLV